MNLHNVSLWLLYTLQWKWCNLMRFFHSLCSLWQTEAKSFVHFFFIFYFYLITRNSDDSFWSETDNMLNSEPHCLLVEHRAALICTLFGSGLEVIAKGSTAREWKHRAIAGDSYLLLAHLGTLLQLVPCDRHGRNTHQRQPNRPRRSSCNQRRALALSKECIKPRIRQKLKSVSVQQNIWPDLRDSKTHLNTQLVCVARPWLMNNLNFYILSSHSLRML